MFNFDDEKINEVLTGLDEIREELEASQQHVQRNIQSITVCIEAETTRLIRLQESIAALVAEEQEVQYILDGIQKNLSAEQAKLVSINHALIREAETRMQSDSDHQSDAEDRVTEGAEAIEVSSDHHTHHDSSHLLPEFHHHNFHQTHHPRLFWHGHMVSSTANAERVLAELISAEVEGLTEYRLACLELTICEIELKKNGKLLGYYHSEDAARHRNRENRQGHPCAHEIGIIKNIIHEIEIKIQSTQRDKLKLKADVVLNFLKAVKNFEKINDSNYIDHQLDVLEKCDAWVIGGTQSVIKLMREMCHKIYAAKPGVLAKVHARLDTLEARQTGREINIDRLRKDKQLLIAAQKERHTYFFKHHLSTKSP